jgi:acetylornithine/succinyldiaminopimelate/putrescine aminotransferase
MLEIVRAEGLYMYDPEGRKYLDLISGVSVSNTGHCHPRVVEAVSRQAASYMHLMVYGEVIQSPQVRYAEFLAGFLPENLRCTYFVNSGSEAVEGAIKLSRRFTGKSKIVSFRNAYHGSTTGALSVQGSESFRGPFRPLLPDTWQAVFNDSDSLEIIDDKTACVIVEPVQGEAGIIFPRSGFLEALREKCNVTGALLVFDEIQTGFGRTGKMFAIDKFGVVPDILLLAKALGGGMPLGAFISSGKIMSALASDPPLGHITTFGGHPVCCAAGLASMQVLSEEGLVVKCSMKSELFKKMLLHKIIREVRGEGLFLAVRLSDPQYIGYVVGKAPDYGLILDYFLFCSDAFRIAPPLIITDEQIVWAAEQLLKLLDDAEKNVKLK